MGRNILLITTDQMRFDALGCNGGQVARTPVIDNLAATGINYTRAHNQNVVCMPARATIVTGQHVASHGVWMNGVPLPEDQPTIAHWLGDHGYQTGLFGKAHFEPWLGSPAEFFENRMASENHHGPHRGFDRMELANHFFEGHSHYDRWMAAHHPEFRERFYPMVTDKGQNTASRGDTGALQVWPMEVPRALYHTEWVADRTIDWLRQMSAVDSWFCWMSFPDPHHPWDIPASEKSRIDWREVPLPALYRETDAGRRELLARKPRHWLGYYEGSLWTNLESPREFVPARLTPEQVREINAMTHIENELIDEACGRVLAFLESAGLRANTDIFFTTDHGELQGDYGLLFKGPYHVDALMRLPFIWNPADGSMPATVSRPVGHLDLASTFCDIAGIEPPAYLEGRTLPRSDGEADQQGRDYQLTVWDSEHGPVDMHLKSIYRNDGWLCTTYEKSSLYEGSEGELYNLNEDPGQLHNLWEALPAVRRELVEQLYGALPEARTPRLERRAPV
ncbi:MAG: sulfatase-like hydrolase/transferase [Proteobacteria bacterium]|nr:sulfatase-like hydrolase/transferase [Pseudomonadota bacterium]